jgi:hypothetical protein
MLRQGVDDSIDKAGAIIRKAHAIEHVARKSRATIKRLGGLRRQMTVDECRQFEDAKSWIRAMPHESLRTSAATRDSRRGILLGSLSDMAPVEIQDRRRVRFTATFTLPEDWSSSTLADILRPMCERIGPLISHCGRPELAVDTLEVQPGDDDKLATSAYGPGRQLIDPESW